MLLRPISPLPASPVPPLNELRLIKMATFWTSCPQRDATHHDDAFQCASPGGCRLRECESDEGAAITAGAESGCGAGFHRGRGQ